MDDIKLTDLFGHLAGDERRYAVGRGRSGHLCELDIRTGCVTIDLSLFLAYAAAIGYLYERSRQDGRPAARDEIHNRAIAIIDLLDEQELRTVSARMVDHILRHRKGDES